MPIVDPVTWDAMAGEMTSEFREVPQNTFHAACHRNAIRVLRDTRAWRTVTRTPLATGRYVYGFDVDTDTDVVSIESMQLFLDPVGGDGSREFRDLVPVSREEALQGRYGLPFGWPDSDPVHQGTPRVYMEWQTEDGQRCFAVAPTPNADFRYTVRPALALGIGPMARGLPTEIYGRLRLLLRDAVLWEIFGMRNQAWYSESRALEHKRDYIAAKNRLLTSKGLARKRRRRVLGGPW